MLSTKTIITIGVVAILFIIVVLLLWDPAVLGIRGPLRYGSRKSAEDKDASQEATAAPNQNRPPIPDLLATFGGIHNEEQNYHLEKISNGSVIETMKSEGKTFAVTVISGHCGTCQVLFRYLTSNVLPNTHIMLMTPQMFNLLSDPDLYKALTSTRAVPTTAIYVNGVLKPEATFAGAGKRYEDGRTLNFADVLKEDMRAAEPEPEPEPEQSAPESAPATTSEPVAAVPPDAPPVVTVVDESSSP